MGGIVGLPALTVEIAWGATAADLKTGAAITWTDITAWVRVQDGVSWSRGRSSEQDTVSAGSLTVTVTTKNAAGVAFHAGNDRRLRTPIRVRWTSGGVPYTLWVGTVTDWGGGWTNGVRATTRITATDLVARVNAQQLQAMPVQTVLGVGSLAYLYPLDEESSATTVADRTGSPDAPRLSTVQVGTGGTLSLGVGYSPGSLATEAESTTAGFTPVDASNYKRLAGTNLPSLPAAGWTVHAMLLPAAYPAAQSTALQWSNPTDATGIAVGLTTAGKAIATITAIGGATYTITGATALSTSTWNHVAVSYASDGTGTATLRLYVNGTEDATAVSSAPLSAGSNPAAVTSVWFGGAGWSGNLANIAAHTATLTATQIGTIAGGRNGWDNETSTARFSRVAAAAGWTNVTVGTGSSTMGPMPTKGQSLANALQAIADTEIAPWWVAGDGSLQFAGRAARYNAAAAFTIPAAAVSNDTQFSVSDVNMVNTVNATRPGGNQVTRTNAASVATYDAYPLDVTLYVRSDADLEDLAAGLANLRAVPQPRSDSIQTDLVTMAASITTVSAATRADVGNLLAVTGLPTDHTTDSTLNAFVEGVADSVNTSGWQRTFNVSPASSFTVWQLDSTIYSVLDSTTRLGL